MRSDPSCGDGEKGDVVSKRELLEEEMIVFDSPEYDDAIIGTTHDGRVVYDFEKMAIA